ncbi:MAG TPA: DUF2157 domain-containing protein [Coleofasciculaceae cyanobacterium]
MVSEKFRRQLRQEAEAWWQGGLIDAALYEELSNRYQFRALERDASHRFTAILIGLGAVLLGLGAITFVAANWQLWPRGLKATLLLGSLIGVTALGFYGWQRSRFRGYQRLGQGLLLLGALLLGANLGFMAQMYHRSGQVYELFLVWGLGVALMAYSLRLNLLGVLALILVEIGYWTGWAPWIAGNWQDWAGSHLLIVHMPLVISLVFVPLAYWCRSQVIFGLSAVAIALALVFNLRPLYFWGNADLTTGWIAAIALILPPALLWAYHERIWQHRPTWNRFQLYQSTLSRFQVISRSLALWFLAGLFYVFAFRVFWQRAEWATSANPWQNWGWSPLVDAAILGGVAILGWLHLVISFDRRQWRERSMNSGTIGGSLIVSALLFIWHREVGVVAIVAFNLQLFLLSLGLVRDGLALGERGTFWGGMVLLVLGIISRMLEYDTGLLLKSVVFLLCGLTVILVGLRFERGMRSDHAPIFSPTRSEDF